MLLDTLFNTLSIGPYEVKASEVSNQNNDTMANRNRTLNDGNTANNNNNNIDWNWQKFLSSNLMTENTIEKPVQEEKKDHFTGTFKRSRKRRPNKQLHKNSEHSFQKKSITESNNFDANWQKFLSSNIMMENTIEKPVQEEKKDDFTGTLKSPRNRRPRKQLNENSEHNLQNKNFTGTFKRSRKRRPNKQLHKNSEHSFQKKSITESNNFDANWQKFLSSSLMMENTIEKSVQEEKKDHFTGTLKRSRKRRPKKQLHKNLEHSCQQKSITESNNLDANWQKFLSSNLMMENTIEKPVQEEKKDDFTGTLKRTRKMRPKKQLHKNLEHSCRKKNITESNNLDANWQKFLSSNLMMENTIEKPVQEEKKDDFTGTLKRPRKMRPKKQLHKNLEHSCQKKSITESNNLDANWQKFLSSNLIMENTIEKPVQEEKKDDFTGTLKRPRKMRPKKQLNENSEHNLQNKSITESNNLDANWQKFLSSNLMMENTIEKPVQEEKKDDFTGTLKRPRKMRPKKQLNENSEHNLQNKSITDFNNLDANWQKFLSSNLMMENTIEKPVQEEKKDDFTGTLKRPRKMRPKKQLNENSEHNLQKKSITESNNLLNEKQLPETVVKKFKSLNMNTAASNGIVKDVEKLNVTDKNSTNDGKLTKFIALDCEMVGVGYEGNDNMLARVSIVNKFGDCIYDKFVKARKEVVDYRTSISGITEELMLNGEDFIKVQREVAEIIRGRVLVGHSLSHDFSVLFLSHPEINIRDTSKYQPFRKITKGSTPSLKRLMKEILGADIQCGQHSSVVDARAVMQLYCTVAKKWEDSLSQKRGYSRKFIES